MSVEKTITEFFEQDHDRLDELFKTFQQSKRSDFPKAKEAFKEFKFGLQRHIVWEEDLLFPIWEQKTGMSDSGPTPVMRNEHRQIGQQLEAIHQKVVNQSPDSDHEEQALYPAIEKVTSAEERQAVFQNMDSIPEEWYKLCCGRH
jgi:iron-sulfur cluster repair protein YtfE (RIC family)